MHHRMAKPKHQVLQGGDFMAGEFVMIEEMKEICYWASFMLPAVFCFSLILSRLTYKILLWMRRKSSKLKWEENYIQRLSMNLGKP
jgi:hypothetical protein